MNAVELRPLGIGEILDVAIKIYLRHFSTFLKIALVIVLPTQLIVKAITVSASDDATSGNPFNFDIHTNADGSTSTDISAAAVGAVLVAALIAWLAGTIATGACFKAVADGYLGATPSWRGSLGAAARRAGSLVWIALLVTIVTGLLAILCLFPGIWFAVGATVAVPVLFTENVRGWGAVQRSRDLVKGRWWPTCGLLIIGGLLGLILSSVLTALLGGVTNSGAAWPVRFAVGVAVGTLTAIITTPFSAAYHTILYVDLRVRKEGFDLALFAHRLGAAPPAAAAPSWGFADTRPETGQAQLESGPPQPETPRATWEAGAGESPPLRPPDDPPPTT